MWFNNDENHQKNNNNSVAELLKNTDVLFTQEDSMGNISDFFPSLAIAGSSGESVYEKVSVYSKTPIISIPYSSYQFEKLAKRNVVFAVINGLFRQ